MTQEAPQIINDDLFLNSVSCPLKFVHITNDVLTRDTSHIYFRQRNKLHIRNAIASRFKHCKRTSNSTKKASLETEKWLRNEQTAICGAVIQSDRLLTRIPILVKSGNELTIVQVHGKLRKKTNRDEIPPGIQKRSTQRYLLKAAYRLEVLQKKFPESDIEIYLYFPNKHFKSSVDNLHLFDQSILFGSKRREKELSDLFVNVRATDAARDIWKHIPPGLAHSYFQNGSVSSAVQKIQILMDQPPQKPDIDRHGGCKYCEFRLSEEDFGNGCWNRFFPTDDVLHPEKHVFELIGHGNSTEIEHGNYYQEQAKKSKRVESAEDVINQNTPVISILNRRNLQILKARNMDVPSLWLKKSTSGIEELEYPLHFLDFEAATYALPIQKKSRPYTSVYFQFSCHTLFESGELIHTEWLDLQKGKIHPHVKFVQNLNNIPGIYDGTIVQYSPFERQGINRLIANFEHEKDRYQQEIEILKMIRKPNSHTSEHRFFDLSTVVRDYYFNEFLNDSLGLKQVLKSILRWEHSSDFDDLLDDELRRLLYGENLDQKNKKTLDPYNHVKKSNISISDGADAMNAWLSIKNGLVSEEEKSIIPDILLKYCALDSLALFVIYKHMKRFTGIINNEDYILYE